MLLLAHGLFLKRKYFSNFLIAYIIHLVPFFIVNGILTALPVVWYNDTENFGVRMGTIPVEDAIYSLLLLLGNVTIYEWLMSRE
jgi:lycopene cyclase domain-containing protein